MSVISLFITFSPRICFSPRADVQNIVLRIAGKYLRSPWCKFRHLNICGFATAPRSSWAASPSSGTSIYPGGDLIDIEDISMGNDVNGRVECRVS